MELGGVAATGNTDTGTQTVGVIEGGIMESLDELDRELMGGDDDEGEEGTASKEIGNGVDEGLVEMDGDGDDDDDDDDDDEVMDGEFVEDDDGDVMDGELMGDKSN
jgi:hypothetical protein